MDVAPDTDLFHPLLLPQGERIAARFTMFRTWMPVGRSSGDWFYTEAGSKLLVSKIIGWCYPAPMETPINPAPMETPVP